MRQLKTFKCLAFLDGTPMTEEGQYYTKKDFIKDLRANGFKFKVTSVKEKYVYDKLVEFGDGWAWDHIHSKKEYEKYMKNRPKYEDEYEEKLYKTYFKKSDNKLKKLDIQIEKIRKTMKK